MRSGFVAVVGRANAGKSTLIKTVAGILPAIDGSVAVDGKEISEYKRRDLAKKVAYLSQGKNTPDMTVEQMVLHGRFPYLEYPGKYSGEDKKIAVDAMAEAKKLGNPRTFNVIILGIAAAHMDFDKEAWLTVIENTVPPKTIDINKKAFLVGYEMAK